MSPASIIPDPFLLTMVSHRDSSLPHDQKMKTPILALEWTSSVSVLTMVSCPTLPASVGSMRVKTVCE